MTKKLFTAILLGTMLLVSLLAGCGSDKKAATIISYLNLINLFKTKAGPSQVSSEKGRRNTATIVTRQKARKCLKKSTFGQNRNHPLTKIFLSIDGVLFGKAIIY